MVSALAGRLLGAGDGLALGDALGAVRAEGQLAGGLVLVSKLPVLTVGALQERLRLFDPALPVFFVNTDTEEGEEDRPVRVLEVRRSRPVVLAAAEAVVLTDGGFL